MPIRHLAPHEIAALRLGVDQDEVALDTVELVSAATLALVSQATRYVDIVTREIDRRVYDQSELLTAMHRVLLGSPRARLRVLTQSIDRAVTYGHRLVELGRRMPTYVEIRLHSNEHSQFNAAYLVSDRVGYLHQDAANRYEGTACFNDRQRADSLMHEFEQMWLSGRTHADLRGFRL